MYFFTLYVILLTAAVHAEKPPVPDLSNFGRVVAIAVEGHFHPVIDIGGVKFKEGMKVAGIMNDDELVAVGKAAMDKIQATFGIDTGFVKSNHILHNPYTVTSDDGTWAFETGMMGTNTNIHVLSETVRTKDGKVKGRKPQRSVRLSFFYMKLVCKKYTCDVTGGTVAQGTEAIVQWLVSDNAGWDFVVQVQGTEMFFTHSPEHDFVVVGIIKDQVQSLQFGNGSICGVLEIDKLNARKDTTPPQPKIKLHYLLIFPDLLDSLPDWASPEDPVSPEQCGHWSCLPALSADTDPTRLHGRELVIAANGYFYRNENVDDFRRILKAVGLETDESVIEWGRSALQRMNEEFGIVTDETSVPDNVILHNPPEATDASDNWKIEVGIMDPEYTNIQIISEALTDKNGNTKVRVPKERIVASFAFLRASCKNLACDIKGGLTVPQGSRAIAQWLVTEVVKEGETPEIQVSYESFTLEMFQQYVYVDTNITRGIVKDVANTTKFGSCETNGNLQFDMSKAIMFNDEPMPKLDMCYIVTCGDLLDELPEDDPASGCNSIGYISSLLIVSISAITYLVY